MHDVNLVAVLVAGIRPDDRRHALVRTRLRQALDGVDGDNPGGFEGRKAGLAWLTSATTAWRSPGRR